MRAPCVVCCRAAAPGLSASPPAICPPWLPCLPGPPTPGPAKRWPLPNRPLFRPSRLARLRTCSPSSPLAAASSRLDTAFAHWPPATSSPTSLVNQPTTIPLAASSPSYSAFLTSYLLLAATAPPRGRPFPAHPTPNPTHRPSLAHHVRPSYERPGALRDQRKGCVSSSHAILTHSGRVADLSAPFPPLSLRSQRQELRRRPSPW